MEEIAYAKINLSLKVLERREDGYHDIETLFQTVSVADTITVRVDDGGRGIEVTSDDPSLPAGDENLAGRAARALLDEKKIADSAPRIRICIRKRIPVGAGLGGGSGDAATTLVALNRLLDLRLSAERLESIGATVGSDVPFLVRGGAAIGRGRWSGGSRDLRSSGRDQLSGPWLCADRLLRLPARHG